MTGNHLKQDRLISDDFLSLKFQDFERLIIFNRPEHETTGDNNKNFQKQLFMRLMHIMLTMAVELDEDSRGRLGIVKPIAHPP